MEGNSENMEAGEIRTKKISIVGGAGGEHYLAVQKNPNGDGFRTGPYSKATLNTAGMGIGFYQQLLEDSKNIIQRINKNVERSDRKRGDGVE